MKLAGQVGRHLTGLPPGTSHLTDHERVIADRSACLAASSRRARQRADGKLLALDEAGGERVALAPPAAYLVDKEPLLVAERAGGDAVADRRTRHQAGPPELHTI